MHGQETLEDYDSCGIFGEEEKTAEPNPTQQNRARIGDDYECLWDCEWEFNPFYKSGDAYPTKLFTSEKYYQQFPFVHTSPQIPKDLVRPVLVKAWLWHLHVARWTYVRGAPALFHQFSTAQKGFNSGKQT